MFKIGPFSEFEEIFPEIVTIDSKGMLTGKVVDFCHWERMEMRSMSKATEISKNVWLGPTADAQMGESESKWDVLIETCDLAAIPRLGILKGLLYTLDQSHEPLFLEFPGSGSFSPMRWSKFDSDSLIHMCNWIYTVANGTLTEKESKDPDGDYQMSGTQRKPRRILIHCVDGYTETSLLALAYVMYCEVLSVPEAWVSLHTTKKRNFYAYERDLSFLRYAESDLLERAARNQGKESPVRNPASTPPWIYRMDGSLPSRILTYMYLGNLFHANNCGLLQALGIKRVLSIGEEVSWTKDERQSFGKDKVMLLRDLQDNGCDPLECQFRRCLEFIGEGRSNEEPVLVHCRVGVSRSATICIAEVMRTLKLSLPRAYCYVRARRLNVIIQPHLRFMYELLKFEESLATRNGNAPKREIEWMHLAREIAIMNRPYTR